MSPRLMMVELNEFDPEYLSNMARRLDLPALQRALSFAHSRTTTADRTEHQGLDPWVQWVGIHCGKPSDVHGIRRLGATRGQSFPQIWHAVAAHGCDWGAWGVMNAPLGDRSGCRFFMPDPWSFDEEAFPGYLNDLLALPRYAAKNYLDIDFTQAFLSALRMVRFFSPPTHWSLLARFGSRCLGAMAKTGPNIHTFTTLLDYLGVLCFVHLRARQLPHLSVIFLNHVAHLQHQFWRKGEELHSEMELGLRLSDAIMGLLLADRRNDEAFLLMNGLKQKNVAGEGFLVYRQRNPQAAIEALNITGGRVEQCMTHDANILFSDAREADRAFEILDRCHLSDGHKVFYVERQEPTRLFYQLAFEHRVSDNTTLVSGSHHQPFDAVFQLVCERTGAHVPEGDIFAEGISIPAQLQNHQVYCLVLDHFRRASSESMIAAEQVRLSGTHEAYRRTAGKDNRALAGCWL